MLTFLKIFIFVFFAVTLSFTGRAFGQLTLNAADSGEVVSVIDLQMKLRKLLDAEAVKTRNVMLCIVDTLPGELSANYELIEIQDEIGNALVPYFGIENSAEFTELSYAKVNFLIEVFKAARLDSVTTKLALKKWHESSDRVSSFVKKLCSQSNANELKSMLSKNIDLTYEELHYHVYADFAADVIVYENIRKGIHQYADKLSKGIVEKFPEKFIETRVKIVQN